MWMGLSILLTPMVMGTYAAVGRPFFDGLVGQKAGIALGIVLTIVVFTWVGLAVKANIKAFKSGERSWMMWVGLAPAMLIGLMWLAMIVAEFFGA